MLDNEEKARGILNRYHQEHLLNFYDELNNEEKEFLINQICNVNFKQIFDLYEASKIDEIIPVSKIEPLDYKIKSKLSSEEFSFYESIGNDFILNNKYAVVTLAGGQRYKTWI